MNCCKCEKHIAPEHLVPYRKGWCRPCMNEYYRVLNKKHYWADHEKTKAREREKRTRYRLEDPVSYRKKQAAWRANNRDRSNELARNSYHRMAAKDPTYPIRCSLKRRIPNAIRGQSRAAKSAELLGCSVQSFMDHIQNQFKRGMAWNNYGKWEVDHIMPCASFDLTDPKQQKICFHFSNLRPLWKYENRRKGTRVTEPQLNLCLSN